MTKKEVLIMENTSKNTDALINIRGTTCKSFVIGRTSISFASQAITNSSVQDLTQYKSLVVKNSPDNKSKIIYDMDIDRKAVRYVSENPDTGMATLKLMDGSDIVIKGSTAGVESIVTSENPAIPGELVSFADTSGKILTKSGYVVANSASLPAGQMVVETVADLEALVAAYQEDDTLDSKIPTMQAVVDYVGSLEGILELRRNGLLPAD